MNLLLDTHTVLWSFADVAKLSSTAVTLLQNPQNEVWVAAVTAWEIAIKAKFRTLARAFMF
jgi:PIN domain nuclease of toxin-antitoxin system